MKSNTKGFTLIELLAVIVILAVIALIATPIILNLIDKARVGAAESSAYAYIEAAEKAAVVYMMNNTKAKIAADTPCTVTGVQMVCGDIDLTLDIKGDYPTAGTVTFDTNGSIKEAKGLQIGSYKIDYNTTDGAKQATA